MLPSAVMLLQVAIQLLSSQISTCYRQPPPAAAAAAAATTTARLQPQPAMLQADNSTSLLTTLLQQQNPTWQGLQQLPHTAMLLLLPHPTEQVAGHQACSSNRQLHCQLRYLGLHLQLSQLLQVHHHHMVHQLPLLQLLLVFQMHPCRHHQHHHQQ
jgi:hypothetical protein